MSDRPAVSRRIGAAAPPVLPAGCESAREAGLLAKPERARSGCGAAAANRGNAGRSSAEPTAVARSIGSEPQAKKAAARAHEAELHTYVTQFKHGPRASFASHDPNVSSGA